MPKFHIIVRLEDYMEYIAEAASEDEAADRGFLDWAESVAGMLPIVETTPVDDDTALGDV